MGVRDAERLFAPKVSGRPFLRPGFRAGRTAGAIGRTGGDLLASSLRPSVTPRLEALTLRVRRGEATRGFRPKAVRVPPRGLLLSPQTDSLCSSSPFPFRVAIRGVAKEWRRSDRRRPRCSKVRFRALLRGGFAVR